MMTLRASLLPTVLLLSASCAEPGPVRRTLTGDSPLVPLMRQAAAEHDVPEELLAALAWSETALRDHSRHWDDGHDGDGAAHAPRSAGVMGLPERGGARSVTRAAELLGEPEHAVIHDPRVNIRGAAAILRALADEHLGPGVLRAAGARDRWLEVAARWFDAGAAGDALALEVRRTIARGLRTTDDLGRSFEILSFAEVYGLELPAALGTKRQAVAGEYPASTWVAANAGNYTGASRTAADVDVVVIHTAQGSYAGTISWFQNSAANVSAHYVVRRSDGDVTQMLRHEDIGWHAGNWSYNERSIGIEHEGFINDPANYTDAMYQSSADLTRWLCDNLGIPKDRSHIIGHIEVPSATHTDPGPHWDWNRYMDLVLQGGGNPPPAGTGMLKGVVYRGTNTADRVEGATVTLTPGGATTTVGEIGYFEFPLAPGDYTITARAPGYADATLMRTVTAGSDTWGSIGITPSGTGTYRGVVYDARGSDLSVRLAGATVRLSSGDVVTTGADGVFLFEVAAGEYTASAELQGWEPGSTTRTVVAGQVEWGSIGLVPAGNTTNRAPRVPALESPVRGVSTVSARPTYTVGRLEDPDGDPLALEVEVYESSDLSGLVSTLHVSVPMGRIATFEHPADDLPRGATLFWRVRASDGTLSSPWTTPESFVTPDDGLPRVPSSDPWSTDALVGVGTNAPPAAVEIQEPVANAVLSTVSPQLLLGGAADPEGDAIRFEVELALDDLFEVIDAKSGLFASAGSPTAWVVETPLAPGSKYYVRARAADERLYGPWSAVVAFSIDPSAEGAGGEPPGDGANPSGADVTATIHDAGGCTGVRGGGTSLPLGVLALLLVGLGRRRR